MRTARFSALESAGGGGAAGHQKVQLSTYLWRDAVGGHHFCPVCGTALMRTGYKTGVSLNARCLEGVDVFELKIGRYDGLKRRCTDLQCRC